MQNGKGTVCDTCGDVGYGNALRTCRKCNERHEHVYCMRRQKVFPIPETWCCEACETPKDSNNLPKPRPPEEEMQDLSKKHKTTDTGNGSSNVPDTIRKIALPKPAVHLLSRDFIPKKVETGKVKYLPVEDIYALSSGAKRKASPTRGGFRSVAARTSVNVHGAPNSSHQKTERTPVPVQNSRRTSVNVHGAPNYSHKKTERPPVPVQNSPFSKTSQQLVSQKSQACAVKPPILESSRKRETAETVSSSKVFPLTKTRKTDAAVHQSSSNQVCSLAPLAKEKTSNRELQESKKHAVSTEYINKEGQADAFVSSAEDGNSKFGEEELTNPPAIEVAWKGTIEILDYTLGGSYHFQAHHPGKVSQKAINFSKGMSQVLQLKLRPRSDVWPEIFKKIPPSGYDIALYFLQGDNYRSEEKYKKLHELIQQQDLCLQSCMGNVELVIYTSQQLPFDSQKLNRHFYLWGVFRSIKNGLSSILLKDNQQRSLHSLEYRNCNDSLNVFGKENTELVDMEVDMVGGKDVGTADEFISLTVSNHSHERGDGSNSGGQLALDIKREQQDNLDGPPWFGRPVIAPSEFLSPGTGYATQKGPVDKSLDASFGYGKSHSPRCSRSVIGDASQKGAVGNLLNTPDHRAALTTPLRPTTPPGFSRPVTSAEAQHGTAKKSIVKMAPVLDVPPGFSLPPRTPKTQLEAANVRGKGTSSKLLLPSSSARECLPMFPKEVKSEFPGLQFHNEERKPVKTSLPKK